MGDVSKYRLRSSAFTRADDDDLNKCDPKRLIVLSVEGETERTYFEHLSEHLNTMLIQIEVLHHKRCEGCSHPSQIIALLEECLEVKTKGLVPNEILQPLFNKYSKQEIEDYLQKRSSLPKRKRLAVENDLLVAGIDLEYRRYLNDFNFDTERDYFAVVLDRDDRSKSFLEECLSYCNEKGYKFFLSNPCFDFWLLLHLCNIKSEFKPEALEEMLINKKVSNRHTYVSKEVSNRTGYGKYINAAVFKKHYLPNIKKAIINSQDFKIDFPDLFDSLGSNLPQLFQEIGYPPE